jgi:gliding motility-associated-like protein
MKKFYSPLLFLFLISGAATIVAGQPVVNFNLSDSSCVGAPINITDLTTGGSTYYWSFCSGNANNNPSGVNIGNPGNLLNVPTYITLVKDGNNCYSFISCQQAGIIRYFHGSSFNHNPISWANFGTFGILSDSVEGIQIKKDNGNWYGFVCNDVNLVRLNFGSSLANSPTANIVGSITNLYMAHGLQIIKEGTTWLGFITSSLSNNLVRLNFGTSLANTPTEINFGNVGGFISAGPSCLVQENGLWWMLVNNGANYGSLSRLYFGTSLFNTPTGQNLGNPGGYNGVSALTLIRDCDLTSGYFANYLVDGQLGKLTFSGGVGGTITGQIIGNVGNLNRPHSFSEIFRQNDTLFTYLTNRGSNTLTRLIFPPCNNSSIPSSNQYNPPPFSYNLPGTYNVSLLVNEGLPDQVSLCKTIVISPDPTVELGPDKFTCQDSLILDAGSGFSTYLWSTGATTRRITVHNTGTYSVTVTQSGCSASGSVHVTFSSLTPINLGPDTTVCQGQNVTFDAGPCSGCTYIWTNLGTGIIVGTGQTFTTAQAGIYKATATNTGGCHSSDTVQLFSLPTPLITTTPLIEEICSGTYSNVLLTSNIPNTIFSWNAYGSSTYISGYSAGTGDTIHQRLINTGSTDAIVTYWITPSAAMCKGDSTAFLVTVTPENTVGVSIVVSASEVCPGSLVQFTATPSNGGTDPVYQWNVNGVYKGMDSPQFLYVPSNNDAVSCLLISNMSCITDNPATSNVIVESLFPVTPVDLGKDTSICQGSSITFNAGPCSNCSYRWSNLSTGQQNIGTGQTYTANIAGTYCAEITDSNGCINRDTVKLSYLVNSPVITGNDNPCVDTNLYGYQTETGMMNYQWTISSGGMIISGIGTNRIQVKWNSLGSQFVAVNYTSPQGCIAQSPTNFGVQVRSLPGSAGIISGPQLPCTGIVVETYSVDTILFATSYVWELPPGFQILSGQGTNKINVLVDTSVKTGDIYVYGTNLCGNGLISLPFHFTTQPSPIVNAGADQIIAYDSSALLNGSITGVSGRYSLSWEPASLLVCDTIRETRTLPLKQDTLFILTATDLLSGCQGKDSVWIRVYKHEIDEDCLVFYNVITPNGDGLNDKWIIDCIENFPENKVVIFNIWGDQIDSFVNYDNVSQVWMGTQKDGRRLPDGTYYYIVTIKNGGHYCGWILLRG